MKNRRVTASEVAAKAGCTVAQVGIAHGFYVCGSMRAERAAEIRDVAQTMGFRRRASFVRRQA